MDNERDNLLEQLSAYLDGELSSAESLTIKAALANDASLADELRALQTTRELLQSIPDEPAPDYLSDRILAKMNRNVDDRFQRQPSRNARWITYATAAVVLVTVGLGYLAILRTEPGVTQGDGLAVVELEDPPAPVHARMVEMDDETETDHGVEYEEMVEVTPSTTPLPVGPGAPEEIRAPEAIGGGYADVALVDAEGDEDEGDYDYRRDSSVAEAGRETDDMATRSEDFSTADDRVDWVTTATGVGLDIGGADILDGTAPGDEPLVVVTEESEEAEAEAFDRALGQFNEVLAGNSIPVENIRFRNNMVEIDVVTDVATANLVIDEFAELQTNDSSPANMIAVALPAEEADEVMPMLRAPTAEVQQTQSVDFMTNGAVMLQNQGNAFSVGDVAVQESVNRLRVEEENRYHRQVVVTRNIAPFNKQQADVLELPSDHQRLAILGKDRGDTDEAGGLFEEGDGEFAAGEGGAFTDSDEAEPMTESRESGELELATLEGKRNMLLAQKAQLEQELEDLMRYGSKMSASRVSAEEASRRNTLQDIRKRLVSLDEQIAAAEMPTEAVLAISETPTDGVDELLAADDLVAIARMEAAADAAPIAKAVQTQKVRFVLQEITPETAGLYRMYAEALELEEATRLETYDQLRGIVAAEELLLDGETPVAEQSPAKEAPAPTLDIDPMLKLDAAPAD